MNLRFKSSWLKEPVFLLAKSEIDAAFMLPISSCPRLKGRSTPTYPPGVVAPQRHLAELGCSSASPGTEQQAQGRAWDMPWPWKS